MINVTQLSINGHQAYSAERRPHPPGEFTDGDTRFHVQSECLSSLLCYTLEDVQLYLHGFAHRSVVVR
jgi:hypothetical protein